MGTWQKTKTGLSPKKKNRKRRSQDFYKESLAGVAVSLHKPYTDLMVGKDAENFDPKEVMGKEEELHDFYIETFDDWLKYGYVKGWCGAPVCYTHDGLPTTEAEDAEFEEGDPCIQIVRLYWDEDEKRGVEENHSPSQWRASNRGL
jgi:hypothetical protein